MKRLRWGVLGVASIATRKVIPGIIASTRGEFVAIASRDNNRAAAFAANFNGCRAHGSYEALLANDTVDAVYIPLPNHLHVEWSIRALQAGKHVLCEKPLGMTGPHAGALRAESVRHPDLHVMEAFMYRCHPRWVQVRDLVLSGAIGALGTVHTIFSYNNHNPTNIRNIAAMGGGAWLDIGCYGVSVARWLFNAEPISVHGEMQLDPQFGTDRLTSAVLGFDAGTGMVSCATQLAPHQTVSIHGTAGRIELVLPFNPPGDEPTQILLHREGRLEVIDITAADQFAEQVDRFAEAVLDGAALPISIDDSVANMKVLDALTGVAQ